MRTLGVWGVAASLGLALAVQGGTPAEKTSEARPDPGHARWEKCRGKSPQQKDAKENKEKEEAAKFQAEAKAREQKMKAAVLQAREDHFRREEILDKLMLVAQENDDSATLKKIDALRERSWNVYLKRTSHVQTTDDETAELDDKPARRGGVKP